MDIERAKPTPATAEKNDKRSSKKRSSIKEPGNNPGNLEKSAKSERIDRDSQLVWTRDSPDRLVGARPRSASTTETQPDNAAPKHAEPQPKHTKASHLSPARTRSQKPPVPKPKEPIDYRRFFWKEPGVEPKAGPNSHDILPPASQAEAEPRTQPQRQTIEQSTVEEPVTAESEIDKYRQFVAEAARPSSESELAVLPAVPELKSQTNLEGSSETSVSTASSPEELPEQPAATSQHDAYNRSAAMAERELSAGQLVEIAKSIQVGRSNLYEMYDTRQVDAEGLHNVVQEYLRGGNVREALTSEMIQTQLKYEKDPYLKRHSLAGGISRVTTRATKTAGTVKSKTTKKVNKQTAKHHAKRVAHHSQRTYGFYRDLYDDYPFLFQVMAIIIGIVLYFALLALIIKA